MVFKESAVRDRIVINLAQTFIILLKENINMKSVQSIDRALGILDAFSFEHQELSMTEISIKLNLPKSTVMRLLNAFEKNYYLEKNQNTKKYRLGIKLLYLGGIVQNRIETREVAKPLMEKARKITGESILLSIIANNKRLCIEYLETIHDLKAGFYVGQTSPLHVGATGKLLLAFLDNSEIDKIIDDSELVMLTKNTITNKTDLKNELLQIRKQQYAFSKEERLDGVIGISVPIYDYSKKVVAALGTAVPKLRMDDYKQDYYLSVLQNIAREISYKMGYKG